MGIALKGDFIGFWIGNTHSSELGIIRTSDGSRFNENLLPTIQDKTVQVPGGDGFYYFGSYYTQRPFNIPIAFDNMSEAQFRRLKQIIGSKEMVQLVFDETPYKYYSVKSTGSPTLKYICFDVEDETSGGSAGDLYAQATPAQNVKTRVYKGEGTLNFVAYDPYGYARAQSLDKLKLPDGSDVLNKDEWIFRLTDSTGTYQYPLSDFQQTGAFVAGSNVQMEAFYNRGDIECDYQIFCTAQDAKNNEEVTTIFISDYQFSDADDFGTFETEILLKLDIPKTESNRSFCFDSKTGCVFGYNTSTGIDYDKIYNKYLSAARFGKLPVGGQSLWILNVADVPNIQAKFRYF